MPVLYVLPAAALAAAWAATWWRLLTCRRALTRERAEARLLGACWARDTAALEARDRARRAAAIREDAVLAQARAVVDAAYAAAAHRTDTPPWGGPDA